MGIQNFPTALQPIIQQGFLEREFQYALRSRLGYRACADRVKISVGIGETLTRTRAGLRPSITTPVVASSNTNLDNGLTPAGWGVEQYTITINHYAATTDLNMVTSRVGIASQFLQNAYVNGEQAARSLDELARNALFNSYFGGNTRVRTTLGSPGIALTVDDVRGFQYTFANGVQALVSGSSPLTVTVGANAYTLIGVMPDATNVSTSPNGVSGVLTFSGNVSVVDGTAGNAVTAANASVIVRPASRATTAALTATDVLTMASLLDAVAKLRLNAVPEIDGVYNCYLDPVSARQLFADPDFKQLFQGATSANQVFRQGMTNDFLGLRFIPTTEAFVQAHPTLAGLMVRRPIICGRGALIEGDFAGMAADDVVPKDSIVAVVDDIAMVTREPIDRLQQIIAQSWYWIGGFCAPSDTTTNPTTVPTATNAAFKRAAMVEHIG
jgi:N4-gp56 family major capsid protein